MKNSNAPIYLDSAASTQPDPQVVVAMADAMSWPGNPSSSHALGKQADSLLEWARTQIADQLGVPAADVIFTSGGSEANNLALQGMVARRPYSHIAISAVEHSSTYAAAKVAARRHQAAMHTMPVQPDGLVDPVRFEAFLKRVQPDLVSIMAVNNEVGAVNDLPKLAALLRYYCPKALFHVDAVQAFGKLSCGVADMGSPDIISLSSHKIHGPQGVGALVITAEARARLRGLIVGGCQEGGKRGGTQNVPGIVGFGVAASLLNPAKDEEYLRNLNSYLVDRLGWLAAKTGIPIVLNGPADEARRAPHIVHISVPGFNAADLISRLNEVGVYASSGSACSMGRPSRVIEVLGLADQGAPLRLSFDTWMTTKTLDQAVQRMAKVLGIVH